MSAMRYGLYTSTISMADCDGSRTFSSHNKYTVRPEREPTRPAGVSARAVLGLVAHRIVEFRPRNTELKSINREPDTSEL